MSPTDGLVRGRLDAGDATILWYVSPRAPVSIYEDPDGCAVLWGDALPRGATARVTAGPLWQAWSDSGGAPAPLDGYHCGVAVHQGAITIGADLLGLFPVYHVSLGEVRLAGSSAAPFARHPLFHADIDVHALLGYLVAGGPFDGRTLQRGVRRLRAGALLRLSRSEPAQETQQYVLPSVGEEAERAPQGRRLAAYAERFGAAVEGAVRRHAGAHDDLSVLLSGGRDSRLLTGYLARDRRAMRAISLGRPDDHDAWCAARVADVLGVPHQVHDIPYDEFPAYADRTVQLEQLAGGMSGVHTWGNGPALGRVDGVLAGYLLEVRHIAPPPEGRAGVLGWMHAHALAPARLRPLLRDARMGTVLEEVCERIDSGFEQSGDVDADRTWRWLVGTYGRFHSGAVPWRLSFWGWPVLPMLDQELLATVFALPASVLANRRLQDELLRREFPALARLPLDRNAHDVRPLAPSRTDRLLARVRRVWRRPGARPMRGSPAGDADQGERERRYYVRMYDFDNPGWRAIRRSAEPGRDALGEWFDLRALESLVPAPEATAGHGDRIAEGFAPKMLTGLMRWCTLQRGSAA